ncbi:MAG: ABC transporter substrate-binding protein [Lachnospiraceae bacterium]|nr:ABC transporter substrate-binding protein [Lachnospiraceae bacterium]
MKMKKVMALFLTGTMLLSLSACGKTTDGSGKETKAAQQTTDNSGGDTGKETKAADSGDAGTSSGSNTPLVIACDDVSEKFSPFFAASVPDQNVADATQIYLVGNDRAGEYVMNGIEGETKEYNGISYTYYGATDATIEEQDDGTVLYTFRIRDGIQFADGEEADADDLIFSFYVFSDPSYDGSASLYSLPIEGMEEYRQGSELLYKVLIDMGEDNTDFSYFTEEQQKQFFETDLPAAGEAFAQDIVDYCISHGYVDIESNDVANGMLEWGFADLDDDGVLTGAATEKTWTLEGDDLPTLADYWEELRAAYEDDYVLMSDTEAANAPLFDFLSDEYKIAVQTGSSADHISGIQKLDDKTVQVTLTSVDATALGNMNICIAPLHYYGDESLYDYDNNSFGFTKGDLSTVREKTNKPMGAGPYTFVKYENKIVYLKANENYYKGAPATKEIQFKVTSDSDKVPGIVQGTVDMASPSVSKAALEQIASYNTDKELNGDVLAVSLTDYNGYGYIGMNSQNVKVGDDPGSEASRNLRKAIATVIAVYRDVVIDSYYGDAASVINYPISNTSWAAPQKSDSDYEVAFSTDVDGNPIYTSGMSEDEKYDAALEAALGFFEAAGYTVKDGKLTAAPEGAKLSYELMIGGGGSGDHPSFGIVTAASEALATIGFELKINDLADSSILWSATEAGTAEIWCAAWSATLDPDMFQIYHSDGGSAYMYRIYSDELDEMVLAGRTNTDQTYRKAIYKEALDFIVDYAVEIPIYQRQEGTVYGVERIDMDTVTPDQTTYYTWFNELEKIAMK